MRSRQTYDEDDMFADSRMSFGDHIEELRKHLWRAIYGVLFFCVIGFVLDQVGDAVGMDYLGIGRPLMKIIQAPVEQAIVEFDEKNYQRIKKDAENNPETKAALDPKPITLLLSREARAKLLGVPTEQIVEGIEIETSYKPLELMENQRQADRLLRRKALTTLSAQEAMMTYFKVTVIAGLVLASPWVFWQIWSFIAKGLYPNEKRYVYWAIGPSTGLFIAGVLVCQFLVMPRAVAGLLWFNDFLGLTPDLRLNEWLSLAIMMPIVFGLSFETPLIMVVLQKLGIMTPEDFKKKRKYAWFGLAVFAMVITPTGDALTMLYLWLPMVALYESGIWVCKLLPGAVEEELDVDVPRSEDLIEV